MKLNILFITSISGPYTYQDINVYYLTDKYHCLAITIDPTSGWYYGGQAGPSRGFFIMPQPTTLDLSIKNVQPLDIQLSTFLPSCLLIPCSLTPLLHCPIPA